MKATKEIDIYLTKKRNVRVIDVVQYDTGIQLVFAVKDFTIPSGATATLYVQKPSGKFVYQEDGITVTGNTVTINLHNQAITEHGKVPYQVSLKSGSDVITTFTGLMMVEKSLKDSGATESKTVIHAFDEAVSDYVAELQTKAEQIVQACIATLPDDYTTMEAKVNDLANAVKGYMSGAVVAADDVSTVEHSPEVWAHGRNLFNKDTVSSGYGLVTASGALYGSASYGTSDFIRVREGGVYSIGWETIKWLCFYDADKQYIFRYANTTPVTIPHGAKYVRITFNLSEIDTFQFVEGETVGDYTAYIAPDTASVIRCGKNLLGFTESFNMTSGGITLSYDAGLQIFGLHGTFAEGDPAITMLVSDKMAFKPKIGTGSKVGITLERVSGSVIYQNDGNVFYFSNGETAGGSRMNWSARPLSMNTVAWVADMAKDFINAAWIYISKPVTFDNYKFRVQIENGNNLTDFEPFKGITANVPAADGTVSGMTSVSPNMTILTDTEGMIVECEYNRDTNKVIDKLINAITALGGKV